MTKAQNIKTVLKQTFSEWSDDKAPKMAAALAYYAVFSMAPILLIAISVASIFFGQEAAQSQVLAQIGSLVGQSSANAISGILQNFRSQESGGAAAAVGVIVLLVTASGVFAELQDSLNSIWEVKPMKTKGFSGLIKKRLLSFGMVFSIGFLLLISLVLTSLLEAGLKYIGNSLPGIAALWQIVTFLVTFGLITVLFASMFRYLPDAKIAWKDLWIGSAITALLFDLGKFGISFYLAHSATASNFGAAASLVALLLWIYYSSQIFFFGAEFIQTYATSFGSGITLNHGAVSIAENKKEMAMKHEQNRHSENQKLKTFKDALNSVEIIEQPVKNDIKKGKATLMMLLQAKKYHFLGSALAALLFFGMKRRRHAKSN